MDEPTAWEDINPATALAARRAPPPPSLERLQPASPEMFRDELTSCLILVAPVGMTEEAKREWLAVAWQTLNDFPADMLAAGCQKARETCDHPSKIVPAIVAETADWLASRRTCATSAPMLISGPAGPRSIGALMDARGKPMIEAETEMLNRHLEWLGSPMRYRTDGSRCQPN